MQSSPRMVDKVYAVGYSVELQRARRKTGKPRVQDRGFYTSVIKTRYMSVAAFLIGSFSSLSHSPPRIMSDPHPPTQPAVNPMGQSIPVNLVQAVAPIPDTSSQALGHEDEGDKYPETSTSSLRRVVEKTVDKLGRTRSLNNRSPSKRIFSLNRCKGKEPGPLGTIQIHLRTLTDQS